MGLEWSVHFHHSFMDQKHIFAINEHKAIDLNRISFKPLGIILITKKVHHNMVKHPGTQGSGHTPMLPECLDNALRQFELRVVLCGTSILVSLFQFRILWYFLNARVVFQIYQCLSVPSQWNLGGFTICTKTISVKNFESSYWR